jgi:hypothetical protein
VNPFNDVRVRNTPRFHALAWFQALGLQIGAHGSVGNQNVPLRHSFFETLHMNFFLDPLEQAMNSFAHDSVS